jgi:hypothetical protein
MDNNTAFNASEIVTLARRSGGPDAVRALATFGSKEFDKYSYEQLNAIQDAAKEVEATLPDSLFEI